MIRDLLSWTFVLAVGWWWLNKHEHRLNRIEYWINVHHSLIPDYASPDQVKRRGTWR